MYQTNHQSDEKNPEEPKVLHVTLSFLISLKDMKDSQAPSNPSIGKEFSLEFH